jgi:DNA-binding MarR family transcriptional regulator
MTVRGERGEELLDTGGLDQMPEAPYRNIGYLVRDTHRLFRRIMKARIAPFGITVAMWTQLWALWEKDGLTQNELAQRVKLERASVGTILRRMEDLGLIERRPDLKDGRVRRVYLTDKANGMRDGLVAMANGINEEVLTALQPEEADQLLDLMRRARSIAGDIAARTSFDGEDMN